MESYNVDMSTYKHKIDCLKNHFYEEYDSVKNQDLKVNITRYTLCIAHISVYSYRSLC
jgi:hypothetical protein